MQLATVALLALICASVGACSLAGGDKSCTRTQEYHASDEIPSLQVPAGLDKPDQSAGLAIPDEPSAADRPPKSDTCLERPPDYFEKKT